MQDFDKILVLASSDTVELAADFKKLLHTELMLGQSRFTCRHGTLSDGHERITDAQRYYAAVKEMYTRGCSVADSKADAMEAQAELIEAQEAAADLSEAASPAVKLRSDARLLRAANRLRTILVSLEDTMRQMDEFNRVRLELQAKVRAQYPEGIEQAELDNWTAVAKYRVALENVTGQPQQLRHVPLPKEEKAALGIQSGKPELAAWLASTDMPLLGKMETKLLGDKR